MKQTLKQIFEQMLAKPAGSVDIQPNVSGSQTTFTITFTNPVLHWSGSDGPVRFVVDRIVVTGVECEESYDGSGWALELTPSTTVTPVGEWRIVSRLVGTDDYSDDQLKDIFKTNLIGLAAYLVDNLEHMDDDSRHIQQLISKYFEGRGASAPYDM